MSRVFNHKAHREMWDWLANNPKCDKDEWPGWDKVYDDESYRKAYDENMCFACAACDYLDVVHEFDGHKNGDEWVREQLCKYCENNCPIFLFSCWQENNLYDKWIWACECMDEKEKKEIASKIRDIKVRPDWLLNGNKVI